MQLWSQPVTCTPKMFINPVKIKNDIGPIGLWHLSPGAPVSQGVSCTVWSETAMSMCPCECSSCISSTPHLRYGLYERAGLCVESAFQNLSFGPGSAAVPTSASVKRRMFKMVRIPRLLHIPATLSAKKIKSLRSSGAKIAERACDGSSSTFPRSQWTKGEGRPVRI